MKTFGSITQQCGTKGIKLIHLGLGSITLS